ncbi:MAG: carboxylating nicotinate-nucleotide diphosphorylase [Oscillospiraceae bacterium]|nr:carboxylating nicotinate-nucleotide diphosphorylase [Oscillospiraceae bacterium]
MDYLALDNLLRHALAEDIGTGDLTTTSCIPATAQSKGRFFAKEPGVICGVDILCRVFALLDPAVSVNPQVSDGDRVETGTIIAEIAGPARSLLTGERVALNLLGHLSGIATKTAQVVAEIAETHARICDTRKTTPGLRALEKYAVKTGGGSNHRFGLFDGVLIKDNHIIAAGGITAAVAAARQTIPHTIKIEVETESLEQVQEALSAGADIILLDNMDYLTMAQAVALVNARALTEASGNMGEKDLGQVAETGVDFISIGALTHTVRALDLSLRFYEGKHTVNA